MYSQIFKSVIAHPADSLPLKLAKSMVPMDALGDQVVNYQEIGQWMGVTKDTFGYFETSMSIIKKYSNDKIDLTDSEAKKVGDVYRIKLSGQEAFAQALTFPERANFNDQERLAWASLLKDSQIDLYFLDAERGECMIWKEIIFSAGKNISTSIGSFDPDTLVVKVTFDIYKESPTVSE